MSAHYGPGSQEGLYPSSSPPSDSHEAFPQPQYYDQDDAALPRRNTMGSDNSDAVLNDGERYYDHNGAYDPYG